MSKFLISVESACDLEKEIIEKHNIQVAHMEYIINGTTIRSDDPDFTAQKVTEFMKEGAETKTTQINEFYAEEHLRKVLKSGLDVIHISFSSKMSSTYNNFCKVAEEINKNSVNKAIIVDSLCQSGGVGLLVKMLIDAIDDGEVNNIYEARSFLERVRLNVAHVFTVDNLKYLARGGRISTATAFIGNVLQLKPVLRLDDIGVIVSLKKVMGRKTAIRELFGLFKNNYNGLSKHVAITEADSENDAKLLKHMIESEYDVDVSLLPLSPLVTTHSGPGTLAVYFTTDKR